MESTNASSIVLVIVPVLLYGFWKLVQHWFEWKRFVDTIDKLPGPKTHWLYGNIHENPGINEAGLAYFEGLVKIYKTCHRYWLGPFFPVIDLYHPDVISQVMPSLDYATKPLNGLFAVYGLVKPWLGEGLITGSGSRWARNRRLLTPAFHFGVLRPYIDVYNDAATKLIEEIETKSQTEKSVEIFEPVSKSTLSVVLQCAFSLQDKADGDIDMAAYRKAVHDLSTKTLARVLKPFLMLDFIFNLTPTGRQFHRNCALVHKVAEEVIAKRKNSLNSGVQSNKKYLDFLDILLSARDTDGNGLTDLEIREEVDTFLFAGHDTTASAISFTIYSLAKHPEIQERARREVDAVLEGRDSPTLEWDDVQKLEYLTQCIKEAMRLHTTVPAIHRYLTKPMVLNGVTVPPGVTLVIGIYALHHNPCVWGDDYNEYRPDRFDPENRKNMDAYSFIPFSAGPRNCIGQNFAMNELRVLIGRLLHKFSFRLDESHAIDRATELVMRSNTGIKIIFSPIV